MSGEGAGFGGIEARPVRGRAFYATTSHGQTRAAETAHLRWPPEAVFVGQVGGGEAGAPNDRREAGAEADPAASLHLSEPVDQVPEESAPSRPLRFVPLNGVAR